MKQSPAAAAAAAKSLQSCPTLWDPIDGLLPGSSVPGILQARTLEWVAISFSSAWKWKVKGKSLRRVRLPHLSESCWGSAGLDCVSHQQATRFGMIWLPHLDSHIPISSSDDR